MRDRPLVRVLRRWLAGESPAPEPIDALVSAAVAHRLAGTLYHIGQPLSELARATCRQAWGDALGAHLLRIRTLADLWPSEAPPPLVIKGADLAEHLFDDPGARVARDLDLVVPGAIFPALVERLAPRVDAVEWPRFERLRADPPFAAGLRIDQTLIELHAHLQPPHRGGPAGSLLWARGTPGRLGVTPVLWPRPEDRLRIWLVNQAKSAFYGDLADLLDLALILRALAADWEDLKRRAQAWGLGLAWSVALWRLRASGIVPGAPRGGPLGGRVHRLLPPVDAPRIEPPQGRFQLLKWALTEPSAWPAIGVRSLATATTRARRRYPPAAG